ncbi:MAG: hypothetical protein ACKVVP_00275 [Chloroflexota bacterium]
MIDVSQSVDGRCAGSGQIAIPYIVEDEMTVICQHCGAAVPLHRGGNPEDFSFSVVTHWPERPPLRNGLDGTQLMLEF